MSRDVTVTGPAGQATFTVDEFEMVLRAAQLGTIRLTNFHDQDTVDMAFDRLTETVRPR